MTGNLNYSSYFRISFGTQSESLIFKFKLLVQRVLTLTYSQCSAQLLPAWNLMGLIGIENVIFRI